jgi:tellurite resistance protein TehA-like permease
MTNAKQTAEVAASSSDAAILASQIGDGWRPAPLARLGRQFARNAVRDLPPAYFSFVMATGIVSIASHLVGFEYISYALFELNVVSILILWSLNIVRATLYRECFLADLRRHAISPGFFTMVAGTCVFGVQLVMIAHAPIIAGWLWLFAVLLWALITYAVFAALILSCAKPTLRQGLNGLWLISVVATQSIAVLGAFVAPAFSANREIVLFVSLSFFMIGCMLYVVIIAIIFFRLLFVGLKPLEMTPPYWIAMGATAITTQAGAALLTHADGSQVLADMAPFLRGFTLFFWSAGSWWIPLLIVLTVWAYGVRRAPMRYSPQFWGMVFPIGMYTACTFQLAAATGYDFLFIIPRHTIHVALVVWLLSFLGLLRQIVRGVLP